MSSTSFYSSLGLGDSPGHGHLATSPDEHTWFEQQGPVIAPLPHLGFIRASGQDAASFLHGQLTNEVKTQTLDTAQLSAYCQAKGRMLASFLQWQTIDSGERTVTLALSCELLPGIQKRLGMFVLRSKVTLADASENLVAIGWMGRDTDWPTLPAGWPTVPATPYAIERAPDAELIRLPDVDGRRRLLIVAAADAAEAIWASLARDARPVEPVFWRLIDVHSGVARIVAATQEKFVPQMVNFELVGGVSFKKGCYPGQEIVARSQYLGKLKRRTFLATVDKAAVAAGDDVFLAGASEPVGIVVNAEPNGRGGVDALIETTVEASGKTLEVGGAVLHFLPLPYALPAEPVAA